MYFTGSFLLSSGLFDFDLTFLGEGILFLLFSVVVTFVFLKPISEQLDDRTNFIDFNLRKSTFLLTSGYKKVSTCVGLLTEELAELNRQIKVTKNYTNINFEEQVSFVQQENGKLLSQLKGELSIKSAYLFSTLASDLFNLTNTFFIKKFQTI